MRNYRSNFLKVCQRHQDYREDCLNLIASENIKSGAVREIWEKFYDLDGRYAEGENYLDGTPKMRHYQGQQFSSQMEAMVAEGFGKLFGVDFVEPRPISGSLANQSTFKGLSEYNGKKMLSLPLVEGGHITHDYTGMSGKVLGLEVSNLHYDEEEFNIDVEKSSQKIRETEPGFVVLGASLFPFPHPVDELSSVAKEVDAYTVYDAAHVLGLIAGNRFQDPLKEGADLVTSSTHKTFPGGQRGVIFGNLYSEEMEEIVERVQHASFPLSHSNHHLLTLAQNYPAIIEMEAFGEEYADQAIRNARVLAESLAENGIKVLGEDKGFTRSHQVVLDVKNQGGGKVLGERLQEAHIITNKNLLPWDESTAAEAPSGIRLGTQEVTRDGFKERDLNYLGELMAGIIKGEKKPGEVKLEVEELAAEKSLEYGFKSLEEMEDYLKTESY